jgi:hypothetical protein
MNMDTSHVHTSGARMYPGEGTADRLVNWLNDPRSRKQSRNRVEQLLAAAERRRDASEAITRQMSERMMRTLGVVEPPELPKDLRNAPFPDRYRRGRQDDFEKAAREINSILLGYRLTPIFVTSASDRWIVDWFTPGRSARTREEAIALLKLLDLASQGLLARVRRCKNPECGVWFYQRFRVQKFHSEECQQGFFRANPEWKEKRAARMRALRKIERDRDKRGRETVGIRTSVVSAKRKTSRR